MLVYHDDRDHDDNVTYTALLPFIHEGLVTYHAWDRRGQIEAYNHCKEHYGKKYRWQAMIDDDEFIAIPSGQFGLMTMKMRDKEKKEERENLY